MKRLIVYISLFSYGLYELLTNFNHLGIDAKLIFVSNLAVIFCLILTHINFYMVERLGSKKVKMEEEDIHQLKLERIAHNATAYSQITLSISFTTMLAGFILLRDTDPVIALWSLILLGISFVSFFPSEKVTRITNPNFKLPDPQSKNYDQEFLNQFDDGEKFVMLNGLYKLYGFVIWGLVSLASALMFYSVFSGNSQIVSIIGIGGLLLFIQVAFTISLKPSKANLK